MNAWVNRYLKFLILKKITVGIDAIKTV
jgi:hypothetical protein